MQYGRGWVEPEQDCIGHGIRERRFAVAQIERCDGAHVLACAS